MNTLWYRGSSERFHYFEHFVKGATRYRVSREDLVWDDEFTYSGRGRAKSRLVTYAERQAMRGAR